MNNSSSIIPIIKTFSSRSSDLKMNYPEEKFNSTGSLTPLHEKFNSTSTIEENS